MVKPKVCVLRTDGTNCDRETVHAFNLAGGDAEIVHINSFKKGYDPVKRKKVSLADYHILAIPGGFSHGDYIAAGKILAKDLKTHLKEDLQKFINDKKLIIGICNGFQVLVKSGLLPRLNGETEQTITLTYNENGKFECRWIKLAKPYQSKDNCVWTKGINHIDLPIAHGEGKFVAPSEMIDQLFQQGLVVFQYVETKGKPTLKFPANPNNSLRAIAGICDPTGRIFGLMPHPERYHHPLNHPLASLQKIKGELPEEGAGLQIFKNGVGYVVKNLLSPSEKTSKAITYADAGVSVEKGEAVVKKMGLLLKSTWNDKIISDVSGFKAVYDLGEEYLIGATDGVGTKLLVGIMAGKINTVGQDLVAMCVNDLARVGAKPLLFLDYMATGKLDEQSHYDILKGISDGCKIGGFPLLGGETAEMPGMYQEGHFDLAGFVVGRVSKEQIIDGKEIKSGATILGIESSGLHSNGYSLARKVFFEVMGLNIHDYVEELGQTVAEVLLEPTTIYSQAIQDLLATFPNKIKGMAHITGGGIPNKLPKALPPGLIAEIQSGSWPVHPVFNYLAKNGPVAEEEMRRTFNMGLGMILIVNDSNVISSLLDRLGNEHGLKSYIIGKVVKGSKVKYLKEKDD